MRDFRDLQDVEAWLEPMDYQGFWHAIAPYEVILQNRAHCDSQLADGSVDIDTMLYCLKSMAVMELRQRHGLKARIPTPWLKLATSH